ncbi:cob(I)yrinic acid a,c-diamide adenosyltransferase [Acidiphilium sp. AL]|uniref:Corrinoid adenosyltransferase n=1 Tax=Acidiphilium iwatense TaxID=768198 RepID=A0ABS9DT51_9PROT|nr:MULTISPECIES: cob(I)yrinic acid a,c-diamide adenosyltransferase [Acidiphilium]MCF3945849.1 cob(I)yrinic acid a,c-diamide adenosyltransferase [Acidiphilium iwatense]MCU4159270.1 cob(I)yrinic acid a,c-diamide adenosyltransferase [Acidiphilium sp. AL]
MVKLDRIVTRGGDGGETSLADGSRLRKDAARIQVFGALDEANAAIGALRVVCADRPSIDRILARIQNDLFDLGADLATPGIDRPGPKLTETYLLALDDAVAALNVSLAPLRSFVLPGGTEAASRAHLARAVARRAERDLVALAAAEPVSPVLVPYMNRLSDFLFVLARSLNDDGRTDILWVPGGTR